MLAQLLQPLFAQTPGDDHDRARQLARILTGEVGDEWSRVSARRGAEHQRRHFLATLEIVANRPHHLALLYDDIRLDSGFVEDLADRGADHALDPHPLLLLDRLLDPAELNEILRLDDSEHLDSASFLRCPPRREAKCDARFGAVVDDDQIGAFGLRFPHAPQLLR